MICSNVCVYLRRTRHNSTSRRRRRRRRSRLRLSRARLRQTARLEGPRDPPCSTQARSRGPLTRRAAPQGPTCCRRNTRCVFQRQTSSLKMAMLSKVHFLPINRQQKDNFRYFYSIFIYSVIDMFLICNLGNAFYISADTIFTPETENLHTSS